MLAVVKKPHIEISVSGEGAQDLLSYISKKYDVQVVSSDIDPDLIAVEESSFYQEMQKNRVGNLLEAARLKSGLKQKELADKIGIKQNMISDYENGRRKLTKEMITRISKVLDILPHRLEG
jgi:antitoxin component HigA of HigAB toxin-antitoxin module